MELNPYKDCIAPAVEGTLSVCRAAKLHGVKRVVVTSSVYSMQFSNDRAATHLTDKSWSNPKHADIYAQSKTLAELAAWQHQKDNNNCYELATINPGLIIGTPLVKCQFTSADLMNMMINSIGFPGYPPFTVAAVNVVDCA